MIRDPYYGKILEGLEGHLDPNVFEACVVDLLRDAYPGLAPIRGGSDAGMDGAIADGEGEAYPLVATTGDVERNLDDSLSSYIRHGKQRRLAVLATSRALTPKRRQSLEKKAWEKHGFTLVNVHDRHDLAGRLYRKSRWVRDLLGIPGNPPALSAVPRTHGIFQEIELLGRDADLEWLRETRGDRLVVGQPGSGKTALLLKLVREGKALFLASDDEAAIANASRDLEPPAVLVDDAHADPKKLVRLRQIREDIGAGFAIVASTWPGAEKDVAAALGGLGSDSIRQLELLTRKEIVEVLRGIGVSLPDDDPHLRLLVDQAANKPGLAVTLGSLWLRGEWRDVLTGRALQQNLLPTLKRVLEHDPTQLLACFALGGDRGMSLEVVDSTLGLGRAEVHRQAVRASHGGVLTVHRDDRLSVHPEPLRSALLGEVFFTSPRLCPYRDLLDRAADRRQAVETLAIAAARRVKVPRDELQALLLKAGTSEAWRAFATLGQEEAGWVLENFPGSTREIAASLLTVIPRPMIQRLLHEAEGVEGPLHSQPYHPLRLLQGWVREIPDSRQYPDWAKEALRRRRLAVEEAKKFLEVGGDHTVVLRACFLALSPELESGRNSATGQSFLIRRGILPSSAVPELKKLWGEVLPMFGLLTAQAWSELENTLQALTYPNVLGRPLDETESAPLRNFVRQIVSDLFPLADGHPGFLLALKKWAERLEMPLDIELDEIFCTLFALPAHQLAENWEEEAEKLRQIARGLALRWVQRSSDEAAELLAFYAQEARMFSIDQSSAARSFFRTLAREVESPESWLDAFLKQKLDPRWLEALLEHVVKNRKPGWEEILRRCLADDAYAWLAADVVLRSEGMPRAIIDAALARISPNIVETACLRSQVPQETLHQVLRHPREEVALAGAIGEWLADPKGEVRKQLQVAWREALLRVARRDRVDFDAPGGSSHWLREILGSDPDLAAAWLEERLKSVEEYEVVAEDGVYAAACSTLTADQRQTLLQKLESGHFAGQLIPLLVGDSVELYKNLLTQKQLRRHHLAPLAGKVPDATWSEIAQLALQAGHDPREIAGVAFHYTGAYSGYGVEHWSKWKRAFEGLLQTAEGPLREVAEHGATIAQGLVSNAAQEQRRHELTGEF